MLLIGASSFIGQHLAGELRGRGVDFAGTFHRHPERVSEPCHALDILDIDAVTELFKKLRPPVVFHLAAESAPSRSWEHPQGHYRANLEGTVNVAQACAALDEPPLLVFPSTAHVYGHGAPADRGIREDDPCRPASPYAISKWAAECHLSLMSERDELRTIIFRIFNQFGPGQRGSYFIPDMGNAIIQRERSKSEEPIQTGNLRLRRDFLDVRDAATALALAADPKHAAVMSGQIYNLGCGEALLLSDLLGILLSASKVPIKTETDPQKLRPNEPPSLWADIDRLNSNTGWRPQRAIEDSLLEVIEEMRR